MSVSLLALEVDKSNHLDSSQAQAIVGNRILSTLERAKDVAEGNSDD